MSRADFTGSNRHGLTRSIPVEIKREVRQRCRFGCVMCGRSLTEYHHFDPPFRDATSHCPNGIVLLCRNCHDKFDKLPIDHMRRASANPKCAQVGYAFEDDFLCPNPRCVPQVSLAHIVATSGQIIRHNGEVLLGLTSSGNDFPLGLTARIEDQSGTLLFSIEDNELKYGVDRWDVRTCKASLVITAHDGAVAVEMNRSQPDKVSISRLRMAVAGGVICCDTNGIRFQSPKGGTVEVNGSAFGEIGIWIRDSQCLLGAMQTGNAGCALDWSRPESG